jgi:hypothetical protein
VVFVKDGMTTDVDKLKELETISVSGVIGNPTIPEDKALKCIIENVNKSLEVFVDFLISTREPVAKRTNAVNAITKLHTVLNDMSRLYTNNVCRKNTEEEMIEMFRAVVGDLTVTNASIPSYASVASTHNPPAKPTVKLPKFKVLVYPEKTLRTNSSENTKKILMNAVDPKTCKIKVDKIIKIRDNGPLLESTSPEIETLLDNTKLEQAHLSCRRPRKIWPKIIVYDVDPEVEHDELLNLIYDHVQGEIVMPTEWCASAVKVGPKRPRNN